MILFSSLAKICQGTNIQLAKDRQVRDLIIDSRKAPLSEQALFFAIIGSRHDGHQYISTLYSVGIRQFVIERSIDIGTYPEANFLLVKSTPLALQALAGFHRKSFNIPVVGITGSNGKTIIKEWLYQLLSGDFKIVKNPGSYNSQLGVPLSVWQMQAHHQFGIFEAGISMPDEMERLARIIDPSIGIFTNIGSAHDEGFSNRQEKIQEKLKLFTHVEKLVYNCDNQELHKEVMKTSISTISWGFHSEADYQVKQEGTHVKITRHMEQYDFHLPFTDKASTENVLHCIILMLNLKYTAQQIQSRIQLLRSVPMRLELKQAINNCQIIDDSYNNDLGGLQISLDFLVSLQKRRKTLILSDVLQTGLEDPVLAKRIAEIIFQSGVHKFIGIGPVLFRHQEVFKVKNLESSFYESTEAALESITWDEFNREIILVKGARIFQFEKIVARLQRKIHGTRMEIDLNKMVHNLNFFKSRLHPGVKLMVMVKAFAYGSGSEEVANLLQYHRVDYLGVAYADEGVELRKNQISLPIMVMNPTEEAYPALVANNLEPVIYSLELLRSLSEFLHGQPCRVHLEIETGMHRLGLEQQDLNEVLSILKSNQNISIASIFSHLAGADESKHDDYSTAQWKLYQSTYQKISDELKVSPIRHLLNSPGILRMPNFQMDMVRLGIGLYGVNPTSEKVDQLQPVATLKTVVSQIKKVKAGESVGYGRWGKANQDMTLATIAIGYADGFSRSFSRGVGRVLVNGKRAPVFGNVCMDMTMIDVSGTEVKAGDEVIVFGDGLPIHEVAASIKTIPYEILTNTSERVKRVFFAESI
jgi:Alr-MurF fusion protein